MEKISLTRIMRELCNERVRKCLGRGKICAKRLFSTNSSAKIDKNAKQACTPYPSFVIYAWKISIKKSGNDLAKENLIS